MKSKLLLTIFASGFMAGCVVQLPAQQPEAATFQSVGPAACPAQPLGAQFDQPLRRGAVDNDLFDAAILHYTNERRCANGLRPLAADAGLTRVAGIHSADMASRRFFSHTSPVPGRETLGDRLKSNGVKMRGAAENIASRSRLQIGAGQPFYVIDKQNCKFESYDKEVRPHTYQSIAKTFVAQWESSPGHRKNLMSPSYTRLGSGAGFQSNADVCGDIVATQNFAS